ncbi:MAG: pyridoxamine 5'-phosphate oxidase family protein [Muribaculaceae bacterium]|nr:pyridoxamine 5'-phosphate oxidase family protein [Muribaculaceae bacterium]
MRKLSRQQSPDRALEVFDKAPYVTVSMIRPDGTPYGLPLSLVRKDERTFYFHCAGEGEKIDCMRVNNIVSLSAVSRCAPKYEEEKNNFTEYYDSAIAVGITEPVGDDAEKTEALRLLCERILPKDIAHFDSAITRSLARTTVIRITLTEPPVGKKKGKRIKQ